MFSARRTARTDDRFVDESAAQADGWDDDRLAEIAELIQRQTDTVGAHRMSSIPDDVAAELEADLRHGFDPLAPVDFNGEATVRRPFDAWDDEALQAYADDMEPYQDFEPDRIDEGVLPPHTDEELAAAPPTGRRRMLLAGAGAGAILLAGLAAYALIGGDGIGGGAPTLVRAPDGPFKIVPEPGEASPETLEPSLVFDGRSMPVKGEERLVTRPDEVPALPGITEQVNRVILPDGQEIAPEPLLPADTGPRRVRTVLVKPDGTIIESPDGPVPSLPTPIENSLLSPPVVTDPSVIAAPEDAPSAAGLPPIPVAEQVEAPEAVPPAVEVAALQPDPSADPTAAPGTALLPPLPGEPAAAAAPSAAPTAAPVPPNRPAPPAATIAEVPPASTNTQAPAAVAPIQAEAPPPATQPPAPTTPSVTSNRPADREPTGGPLDLAAAANAPAEPAAPASSASAFVQVSSQRSQEAAVAAFQALQRKHPDLLGGVQPDVQRADLGAKGIFYRVRIPATSRDQAAGLCDRLRAAGSDCLIARR